jgi:exopolyphosphatase/guanosine-5'-triphosphate,3'-diphosphate pyrophosphatase
MALMRVGVIDVGANTVRLLVTDSAPRGVAEVYRARVQLGLGEDIAADGVISDKKIEAAAKAVREQRSAARRRGAQHVEVVVTSPGRQAGNADALVAALEATAEVRVLSAEEEARLGYAGAVASVTGLPESVAVCDVGGGSMQVVFGTRAAGPVWARSFDIGSLRLTRGLELDDPPEAAGIEAVRSEVAGVLAELIPPLPRAALATGGTARALRKLVGSPLDERTLADAVALLEVTPVRRLVKRYRVTHARARTVAAGSIVLDEVQRRLRVPLEVVDGGVREGVALALLTSAEAAA